MQMGKNLQSTQRMRKCHSFSLFSPFQWEEGSEIGAMGRDYGATIRATGRHFVGQRLARGAGSPRGSMALFSTGRFPEKLPTCPGRPLPPAPLSPCAWSGEAMMNFPQTALQTVINNALLFGDGTFH